MWTASLQKWKLTRSQMKPPEAGSPDRPSGVGAGIRTRFASVASG